MSQKRLIIIGLISLSIISIPISLSVLNQQQELRSRAQIEPILPIQYQTSAVAIKAFPTAEGFGANAVGGRGGAVIEVTNLNDSGAGSLRSCIEASGPRNCVFRIGGTITLNSGLTVNNPYLTIAGQTATGDGITLRTAPTNAKGLVTIAPSAHDVIIRFIRVRTGTPNGSGDALDAITMNSDHTILDHVSLSWAIDENLNTWYATAHDITIQWSIVAEALNCNKHPKGCHSKGALIGDDNKNISVLS